MEITVRITLQQLLEKLDLEEFYSAAEEIHVVQDADEDGAVTIKLLGVLR